MVKILGWLLALWFLGLWVHSNNLVRKAHGREDKLHMLLDEQAIAYGSLLDSLKECVER